MNDSGRTRDLPIDVKEAKDLSLHVAMCGQRYNQLVDALNEVRNDLKGNRQWNVAIFTVVVTTVLGAALKSFGVIP